MRRTGRFLLGLLLGGLLIGLFGFLSNGFTLKPSEWGDKFKPAVPDTDEDEQERSIEIVLPNDLHEFTDNRIAQLEMEINGRYYDYSSTSSFLYPMEEYNIYLSSVNENSIMVKFEFLIDEVAFVLKADELELSDSVELDMGYRYDFSNLEAFDFDNNKLDPVITEL